MILNHASIVLITPHPSLCRYIWMPGNAKTHWVWTLRRNLPRVNFVVNVNLLFTFLCSCQVEKIPPECQTIHVRIGRSQNVNMRHEHVMTKPTSRYFCHWRLCKCSSANFYQIGNRIWTCLVGEMTYKNTSKASWINGTILHIRHYVLPTLNSNSKWK